MSSCILWKHATNNKGYGHGWWEGEYWLAHRRTFHEKHGPIPPGKQVRHLCGNKLCVNPEHLTIGTQSDNEKDKHHHGTARYYAQYGCRNHRGILISCKEER